MLFRSYSGSLPNGMGWNPDDNYIYGFSTTTNLVRIAGNGTITSLGTLTSGDSATLGKAATAQNTGGDFVRINGTEYLLNAGSSGAWTLTNIASRVMYTPSNTGISWAAFDGTVIGNSKIYGVNANTLYIGTITGSTPTTVAIAVTSKTITGYTSTNNFGAAYSDGDGNIYFFDNTTNNLYEITASQLLATSPAATLVVSAAAGPAAPNDGASCPSEIGRAHV